MICDGKCVQPIEKRLIRTFSATTLKKFALEKMIPTQTELKVKYFYNVADFISVSAPRYPFKDKGSCLCPDMFFFVQKKAYILENICKYNLHVC